MFLQSYYSHDGSSSGFVGCCSTWCMLVSLCVCLTSWPVSGCLTHSCCACAIALIILVTWLMLEWL